MQIVILKGFSGACQPGAASCYKVKKFTVVGRRVALQHSVGDSVGDPEVERIFRCPDQAELLLGCETGKQFRLRLPVCLGVRCRLKDVEKEIL